MAMGRKRTVNCTLPPHMRVRKGRYYYDTQAKPRREIPLGADYAVALVKWAELEGTGLQAATTQPTFGMAWARYRRDVLPGKAPRTQTDNLHEVENLLKVFRDAPLAQIRPTHMRDYLDARGKVAPVRANREKALFSHIYNKARGWGYTDAPNPCAGIKGFREDGRDKYVEDAEYWAVYAQACVPVRNAMDLAYLSAQRPGDVLRMTLQHVQDGTLRVRTGKTGAKLRIALEGRFAALIAALTRPAIGKVVCPYLIRNEDEQPMTLDTLRQRFQKIRAAAIEHAQDCGQHALAASLASFQFRDLRAKGASDIEDLRHANTLLAHPSEQMTEHYRRKRVGALVRPVK